MPSAARNSPVASGAAPAGRKRPALKIPKKIGEAVDLYYTTRLARLAAEKVAADIDADEKLLREHLINTIPKSAASGIAGRLARATIVPKIVPTVEDWDAFHKYVIKTKDFSLLQKRLGEAAIRERWDAGKKVPGVIAFNAVTVSLNKV